MYRVLGEFVTEDGHTDFSFRDLDRWTSQPGGVPQRVTAGSIWTSGLTMGDPTKGPIFLFIALAPGITPQPAPAHMHASDNWRISLNGKLPMGPEVYGPGQFRFQRGRKAYPSDSYSHGPEGGWMALCFADRRGQRVRHIDPDLPHSKESDAALAEWLGNTHSDLISDAPEFQAGPSAMATDISTSRAPHLNGDFANTEAWHESGDVRLAVGLQGDLELGPVFVLLDAKPNAIAESAATFDTEVFRIAVSGSARIGDTEYLPGDMRIQEAGVNAGDVVAGPEGFRESIVIADRRAVSSLTDGKGWLTELPGIVAGLSEQIRNAPVRAPRSA